MDPGSSLRLTVKGETMRGKEFTKTVMLTVGNEATPEERLAGVGIETYEENGKVLIDNVAFASAAEKAGLDFDQEILNVQIPTKRMPKELMYIPAVFLYGLITYIQLRRRKKQAIGI